MKPMKVTRGWNTRTKEKIIWSLLKTDYCWKKKERQNEQVWVCVHDVWASVWM